MQKPEIPINESDRLVALDRYKILDTLPEQVYDDLTQLAADICGTPIALISLIDKDRQWFKSRVGIDATETPRDISFCGHAVAESAILNVPDASLDPRFADNPLVTKDPNIRFYVGVPLITDDNFALGTLCVIDRQPRDLTEKQIRQLEALSRLVISQFELRLNKESLRILASVVESSDDAIMTKTLEGIITSWNPAAEKLFGYSQAEAIGQPIFMLIPPDLLDEEFRILARLRRGERLEHFETVRTSKEGKRIEVSATISPLVNDAGQVVGASTILRDIHDRKQTELQLQNATERLTLALKSGAIGCWEWDIQQNFLIWDDRMYELYGNLEETYSHLPYEIWSTAIHPDDRDVTETLLQQAVLGRAKYDCEFRIIHCDGSIHFIKAYGRVKRDSQGNAESMIGVNFDISDRKAIQEALKRSEERALATLVALPDLVFRVNRDGQYMDFLTSPLGKNLVNPDQSLGKSMYEALPVDITPNHVEAKYTALQQALATQTVQAYEQEVRIEGTLRYEEVRVAPCGNDEVVFFVRDISDRKLAEEALRASDQRWKFALEGAGDGVWDWDVKNNEVFYSPQWKSLLGYADDEIENRFDVWESLVHPDDLAQCNENINKCLNSEVLLYESEHRLRCKDGSYKWILSRGKVLEWDANGHALRMMGTHTDLSDRKQAEAQLQKINDELLRATKLKDEFLANMSHELRTPLNSILGFSESLKDEILGSLNEKQLKAIATVESSGEHLLALINDILDLSKISSGMVELDIASVSVKNLCSSSLVFVKQQAFNKKIQIHSNIPPHINNINIDERRIKQVLINLLTNAVKFTPNEGNINLLVAIGSGDTWQGEATIPQQIRDMNSPTILFQVVDTGIGIAAKDLQMLFQPFVQVDSALNRQYEGTGLGLALVKQLVELHGGQVMAESEVGKGSRFTVALPYEISASNAIASTPTSTTSSSPDIIPDNAPLILLAEDNEANIQTFSSYLTAINYRVIIARNGIEAIAQAKENLPDIILMDIQMPIMDGLAATKQIRLDPNLINTPIIALTALAMEGDREKCLTAGANEYLAKPVKLRQLNLLIQQVLGSVN